MDRERGHAEMSIFFNRLRQSNVSHSPHAGFVDPAVVTYGRGEPTPAGMTEGCGCAGEKHRHSLGEGGEPVARFLLGTIWLERRSQTDVHPRLVGHQRAAA